MKLLGEFAIVHMGYTFRGSLKFAHEGDTAIIQVADATEAAIARPELLARANLLKINPRYLLCEGDIIVRARGLDNSACLITAPLGRMVCIAPLIHLRVIDRNKMLPAYLHWYINLANTQAEIAQIARTGAYNLRYIRVCDLARMPLFAPPISQQQEIVESFRLQQESHLLESQLAKKRLQCMESTLLRYAELYDVASEPG